MSRILVLFATREGHTRAVARRVAAILDAHGLAVDVGDARERAPDADTYDAVVALASIHVGRHEPELVAWAKRNAEALASRPNAFLSVSMSAATRSRAATPLGRDQAEAAIEAALAGFVAETGWRPDRVVPVAGALPYTRVGWLKRALLRFMAGRTGMDTDTGRDHVYTDWAAIDAFAADFARAVAACRAPAA